MLNNYDSFYLHSKKYKYTNPLKTVKYLIKSINKGYKNSYLELGRYYNKISDNKDLCIKYYAKSILSNAPNKNYAYIELALIKKDYFLFFIKKALNNKCPSAYVEYINYLLHQKPLQKSSNLYIRNVYKTFLKNTKFVEPNIYVKLTYFMYKTYVNTNNKYMAIYYLDLIYDYLNIYKDNTLYINCADILNLIYLDYKKLYKETNYEQYLIKALIINYINMHNRYIKSYFNHINNCFLLDIPDLIKTILDQMKTHFYHIFTKIELFLFNLYNYIYNYKINNADYNIYESYIINNYNESENDNILILVKEFFNIKNKIIYTKENIVCPILYAESEHCFKINCGHKFSFQIFNWILNKKTCPTCREQI